MTAKPENGIGNRIQRAIIALLCAVLVFVLTPPSYGSAEGGEAASYELLKQNKRTDAGRSYETPKQPTVYLTFDDGPSKLTPEVLDILKKEEVKATFFVLGEQVEARPDLIKRMVKEGHALGNHSYNHVYPELYAGFGNFWLQVQKTEQAIQKAAGIRTSLVRAPGGTFSNFDAFYFHYLEQAGYEVHDWNIDSEDARRSGMSAEQIYAAVAKGPFRHETVVLMHDSAGHGETVKALPGIIRLFKEKGYVFAPLTAEVKPIQFSSGKSKWPRNVSFEAYQNQLSVVKEAGRLLAEGKQPERDEAKPAEVQELEEVVRTQEKTDAKGQIARLQVKLGEKTFTVERPELLPSEQRFQVPLRQLAETLGGQVEWREESRVAAVRLGLYQAEYDLAKRELRVTRPGTGFQALGMQTIRHSLPDMGIKEGALQVPLQRTLELLGHEVKTFESGIDRDQASVRMALHSGFGAHWGTNGGLERNRLVKGTGEESILATFLAE